MNCTVRLTPGACEIWTGTQVQTRCQEYAAKAADVPIDKVTVNNHYLGGGFGRRLEPDMVASAVRIAKRVHGEGKRGVVVTLFPDRADRYFEAPVEKQKPVPPAP